MADLGERCDRHSGETYLPRCYECAALQVYIHPTSEAIASPVYNATPNLVTDALASWGLTERTEKRNAHV